jgi:excisionase family DNA binding protein
METTQQPHVHGLWTAREAANFLRCSTSYVYKAAERDLLPSVRIGRMLRFAPDAVKAYALGPVTSA